jgi:hypothetical protein
MAKGKRTKGQKSYQQDNKKIEQQDLHLCIYCKNVVVQIRNVENTKGIIRTHQWKKDRQ